jgi:hypothetical protein
MALHCPNFSKQISRACFAYTWDVLGGFWIGLHAGRAIFIGEPCGVDRPYIQNKFAIFLYMAR